MKINIYSCRNGHKTIIRDTEPREVTPAQITCPDCKQSAWSHYYEVDQTLKPEWEWFVPKDIAEMKEACLPLYGDAFSEEDYKQMLRPDANCKVMYRKIQITRHPSERIRGGIKKERE